MMTILENTLYTWKLLREWILNVLITETAMVTKWGDRGVDSNVVTTTQCLHIRSPDCTPYTSTVSCSYCISVKILIFSPTYLCIQSCVCVSTNINRHILQVCRYKKNLACNFNNLFLEIYYENLCISLCSL